MLNKVQTNNWMKKKSLKNYNNNKIKKRLISGNQ